MSDELNNSGAIIENSNITGSGSIDGNDDVTIGGDATVNPTEEKSYYHGFVILSEQEYQQLYQDGSITKNGKTINYDENTTYSTPEQEIESGIVYTQSDSDIAQHVSSGDVSSGTVIMCNEKITDNEYQLGHFYVLSNVTGSWVAKDITSISSVTKLID